MAALTHASGQRITVPDEAVAYYMDLGWTRPGTEAVPLSERKVDELRAYAETNSIDLGDAKKKADIVAVIEAAEQEGEADGSASVEAGAVSADADTSADS
jgi:hypothetical protein